ncbi:hypothetical protein SCP_1800850 [Sparassis crispa]|uniref:Uncharacterized protein n=1 Tax=Sparassis crispa TaxID=139825 RepID=A0A401H6Q8_9APHY|nr:hypothetical protein SCP_1800850 [Sparassis crispa]GBE90063.1 hypothetical protein SCP_1800850 [Sparassis crispa]
MLLGPPSGTGVAGPSGMHEVPAAVLGLSDMHMEANTPVAEEFTSPIDANVAEVQAIEALPIPPLLTSSGRPIRTNCNQLPARYRDVIPEGPTCMSQPEEMRELGEEPTSAPLGTPVSELYMPNLVRSLPNSFSLVHQYLHVPLRDPDDGVSVENLVIGQAPRDESDDYTIASLSPAPHLFGPYPNKSSYLLGWWYWNGSMTKSKSDFKDLLAVLSNPRFTVLDLVGTKWDIIDHQLGDSGPSTIFNARDGWRETLVVISIPSGQRGVPPADFKISGIFYCPLEEVTRAVFESTAAATFHFELYTLL